MLGVRVIHNSLLSALASLGGETLVGGTAWRAALWHNPLSVAVITMPRDRKIPLLRLGTVASPLIIRCIGI
jgi:hypothetical protein